MSPTGMILTKQILDQYISEGWLVSQRHPQLPLTIYNYSKATQYNNHWDWVTLQCRGLVIDQETGKIVARPFRKFFNLEEGRHQPTDSFEVFDKMDGSLIIAFHYQGSWVLASRGSFISDQALAATRLFAQVDTALLQPDVTYLFELTAAWNRIVVHYDAEERLTLLGAIHTDSGVEVDWSTLEDLKGCGFELVQKYNFTDYTGIQALNWQNSEGFIVRFTNGDRCKIKFAEYVRLHRLLTNCTSYDIWESLRDFGKLPEELLDRVPDEFHDWVRGIESELKRNWAHTFNLHMAHLSSTIRDGLTAKAFAERIVGLKGVDHGILFALYHGNVVRAEELIWKVIKPKWLRVGEKF